jgi:uncharacterized protein YcbX
VKSVTAVPLETVLVGPRGFAGDRDWMVVDQRGQFLSQRTLPQMTGLQAKRTVDGLELMDRCGRSCRVATPFAGDLRLVSIWDDTVPARDAGDLAADFLSTALGAVVRLVWMPDDTVRPVDPAYAGRSDLPVSFADGFPLLVTSESSLDDLNRRLPENIPMLRFRPNLVIRGWPAFAEDGIRRIRCGNVELDLVKPCTRCIITTLDPVSGEKGVDPTPVLKSFRYDRALRGVTFGMNALVSSGIGQSLQVGDIVEVLDA